MRVCFIKLLLVFNLLSASEVDLTFPLSTLFNQASNESEVEIYFVDYSNFEQFSPEIVGIYVIDDYVPDQISDLAYNMAQLLNQYLFIRENSYADSTLDKLLNIDLFSKFSQKHYNYHTEIRNVQLMLNDSKKNIKNRYSLINKYILKREEYYGRQNNKEGIDFCKDIQKFLLKPMSEGFKYYQKDISTWGKSELTLAWNDFQKNHSKLIKRYFDSKDSNLILVRPDNTFEINVGSGGFKKSKNFYLSIKMLGQNWYLELSEDSLVEFRNVGIIKL